MIVSWIQEEIIEDSGMGVSGWRIVFECQTKRYEMWEKERTKGKFKVLTPATWGIELLFTKMRKTTEKKKSTFEEKNMNLILDILSLQCSLLPSRTVE